METRESTVWAPAFALCAYSVPVSAGRSDSIAIAYWRTSQTDGMMSGQPGAF
jgi:hypothetical protein